MSEVLRKPAVAFASVAMMFGAVACSDGVNTTKREVTICDKERVVTNESSEYRVYTSDGKDSHTYKVVDTLVVGGTRMDSADFYGSLRRDTTYDVKSSGFRQGFLDEFPNIIEVTKLPEDQQHPEWCE